MPELEQQPERQPSDGPMTVERLEDGRWLISVETDGERQSITCGGFNVWRVFGSLAFLLGVALPKKVSKSIKLTD